MEIGSLFLILAVSLIVGLYVVQPFLERRTRSSAAEAHEVSTLLAERDRVVNALQELDFDFNLKKIPAEDYPIQRAELLQKGVDVLKALDALMSSNEEKVDEDTTDRIESAVAARRADTATAQALPRVLDDDDLEAMIAARRTSRKEKSAGFCPRCGKPILASDRFCPSCGKSIT